MQFIYITLMYCSFYFDLLCCKVYECISSTALMLPFRQELKCPFVCGTNDQMPEVLVFPKNNLLQITWFGIGPTLYRFRIQQTSTKKYLTYNNQTNSFFLIFFFCRSFQLTFVNHLLHPFIPCFENSVLYITERGVLVPPDCVTVLSGLIAVILLFMSPQNCQGPSV